MLLLLTDVVVKHRILLGSWLLLYPLWYHASMQVLHLLPVTPLLPAAAAFVPFSAASPLALPPLSAGPGAETVTVWGARWQWWRWLAGHALGSNFMLSFVLQSVYVTLLHGVYNRALLLLPAPCYGRSIPASLLQDDYSLGPGTGGGRDGRDGGGGETGTGVWMFDDDVATATASINPRTGEFSLPVHTPAAELTDPLELADPPLPPSPDRHHRHHPRGRAQDRAPQDDPQQRGGHQRGRLIGFRDTALSVRPLDIAASHTADCLSNVLLLASQSVMLRRLARSRPGVCDTVYAPMELRGCGTALVIKALVVGEWSLLWVLFECSLVASSVVGVRWFGYLRHV